MQDSDYIEFMGKRITGKAARILFWLLVISLIAFGYSIGVNHVITHV